MRHQWPGTGGQSAEPAPASRHNHIWTPLSPLGWFMCGYLLLSSSVKNAKRLGLTFRPRRLAAIWDFGMLCFKVQPWGAYTAQEEGRNFKIKRIVVKPGASLSLQRHYHRSEHWVVVDSTASVVNYDKALVVKTDESTYIFLPRPQAPTGKPGAGQSRHARSAKWQISRRGRYRAF